MNTASVGRAYALARVAAGAGLLLTPRVGAHLLGDRGAVRTVRLLGVRDVLLAVDALLATPGSRSWRRAMALGAAADAADAAMTVERLDRRDPAALAVLVSALAGAAAGAWVAAAADARPASTSSVAG